jgi:membrane-bound lytic murein transglycosylase F
MRLYFTNKSVFTNLFFLFLFVIMFASCNQSKQTKENRKDELPVQRNTLKHIKELGVLKAVVDYNSTNYFVFRGKPMGFKYELLQQLSKDLEVDLEIVVSNNLRETFDGLENERFDLVAKNLTVTKQRSKEIDFTVPIQQTVQVLVQRQKLGETVDSGFVNSTLELAGREVYVQKNTSYYRRLMNLSEEIGYAINVVEDSINGVEQLVARVAKGEIDYTVCDQNIAILNKTYYPNLDVSVKVSFPQNIAWAVPKGALKWKSYLDEWISAFKQTAKYKYLYHKYFVSSRIVNRTESDFHSIGGGQISVYDKSVKDLAKIHSWDWRLISAIMYQESRFNPEAGSWAGAYGLMQIMPNTAEGLGIEDYRDPVQNIEGGILLMNWIDKQLVETVPDSTQRIKFVLAAYNIGLGHVKDAQRLAEKYGKDKLIWDDNVDYFLLNKSAERYFKDPVCRFGYCRGEEAYNYVKKVLVNYDHYLNVIQG